jgi:hypothetical protein
LVWPRKVEAEVPRWRRRNRSEAGRRNALIAAAAVVAAAVIGVIGAVLSGDNDPTSMRIQSVEGDESRNRDVCVGGGVIVEGDVHCTKRNESVDPEIKPYTADAGCGLLDTGPRSRSFRLRVLMWCAPESVRGQYEYVLKIVVENTGKVPIDVSVDRFVLLWRRLVGSWSPPPGGAYGEPQTFKYLGRTYWGIPANAVGAAEERPTGAITFATEWSHTSLAPGESSLKLGPASERLPYVDHNRIKTIRYNPDEDDLVFYVPKRTVNRARNFLGLAYVAGRRVVAVCPQERWGPKVSPSDF